MHLSGMVWQVLTNPTTRVRICVGMHFANQALFIMIATALWAANIRGKVDKDGKPIKPSISDLIDRGVSMYVISAHKHFCTETSRSFVEGRRRFSAQSRRASQKRGRYWRPRSPDCEIAVFMRLSYSQRLVKWIRSIIR